MNKGRNIMLLLCCLLVLGCLTFFARTKTQNRSAVVDNVRYVLKSSENNIKNYEFYFTDDEVYTGTLQIGKESSTLYLFIRGEYDETIEDYYTDSYEYYYVITGSSRKDAKVEYYLDTNSENFESASSNPYERFTENVFISMIYGTQPYITIPQAFIVGIFALAGGLIILKAEELWHVIYRKKEDETPSWDDMNGIKRVGIGILIFAAVLLIIFIAI